MAVAASTDLDLADLERGIPRISAVITRFFAEACVMCLTDQGHKSGVTLKVEGLSSSTFRLLWKTAVTEEMRLGWGDEATENAACAIAFLLVPYLDSFTALRRARTGTGHDYWLCHDRPNDILKDAARLEVSGILRGNKGSIRARVETKKEQLERGGGTLPAYVVVAEFSGPQAKVERK